ncbi:MAG TPA: DUF1540 domain-containing protein [Clostridiales bacterium]|nr:DUF1540 domain-containing protein [Clostridiales bacterium]HBJ97782.1 DUF1540 domain-containing protein [Clostridiales bacterium]
MNNNIKCDVTNCKHNVDCACCGLDSIKVTCGCSNCTCCGNFEDVE